MLYHVPNIITPELLYAMRAMGHGDELLITDANFPATSHGQECIRLAGVDSSEALSAILTLLPIDTFVENPFITMEIVDHPETIPPTVEDFTQIIQQKTPFLSSPKGLERFEFYERAKKAFVIIQTSDIRPYANIIVKKGVINHAN
ncbi:ribose ABC transporter [Marinomonas rhizomae]|uniref:L-fucose mutarotase n=1 Tax=Marinomonas rhizomae TaxID=491948 RepID=A0A366JA24_9GAMM|nr:RbsD/FucU domain-containing protein [Marinomonas rhizomae]RBP83707.1 L-fucose mutarotase [Marinomonas rhizomae]RNF69695.1 ribose ABC transporter [Marinomonas rhizomae]